jgi:hypothetical protein
MNPIPATPLFLNGYLDLIAVLAAASLAILFGMLLWNVRAVTRERLWIFCPVRLRSVMVLFRLAPNGARSDVLRCSVFGRRPITCGKVCLHHATSA